MKKHYAVHLCTLSDKFVKVEFKNRTYHFEHTAWAGWVATTASGNGASRDHPFGAWQELKRCHDPGIILDRRDTYFGSLE